MCQMSFLRYFIPKTRKRFIFLLSVFLLLLITTNFLVKQPAYLQHLDLRQGLRKIYSESVSSKFINTTTQQPSLEEEPIVFHEFPSVLVFTDRESSQVVKNLTFLLNSYKVTLYFLTWTRPEDYTNSIPQLLDRWGSPRFHSFIFTSYFIYKYLDVFNKKLIHDHCQAFHFGVIILFDVPQSLNSTYSFSLAPMPVEVESGFMELNDLQIANNNMTTLAREGKILPGKIAKYFHAVFRIGNNSRDVFQAVAYAHRKQDNDFNFNTTKEKVISVLYDNGNFDGVQKVLFGTPISASFLHRLLFIDALQTLSNHSIGFGRKRYIQVDIDDIFVGTTGKKLVPSDVKALVEAQKNMASEIAGFKFALGFSSKFYCNSNASDEREADEMLVKNSQHFRWFCHTKNHLKPHEYDLKDLVRDLEKNKRFAETHKIDVDPTYAVAPHHSGTYPIHRPLYTAWKQVWEVQVTSTEGYPTLYPAWGRRGFICDDVMVLPRQTCGLFTKTLHNSEYPKGPNWLGQSANGGELFWSIVYNPITVFMTHAPNYGFEERLAIPLFKNVTRFVKEWTNIQLLSDDPAGLALRYFEMFPKHAEPLWTDPCMDLRHQKIWAGTDLYCRKGEKSRVKRLPDILILGPQKTGTTALHKFLMLQGDVLKHSRRSNNSFEEIQFFNRNNYAKGIDWYIDFFPDLPKPHGTFYFEKSANYFDSQKSPLRAFSLVPKAKLIVIVIDPRDRAYSWYQHLYSKKDPIALNYTFYEVLTQEDITEERFQMLRGKCLKPGRYAESLERWLQYYSMEKIFIMDGWRLRHQPHNAMKKLNVFLNITYFPYEKHIKWSPQKRFYCPKTREGKFSCLGKGKGREYEKMSVAAHHWLTNYYRVPNLRLAAMLKKYRLPLPKYLEDEIRANPP